MIRPSPLWRSSPITSCHNSPCASGSIATVCPITIYTRALVEADFGIELGFVACTLARLDDRVDESVLVAWRQVSGGLVRS